MCIWYTDTWDLKNPKSLVLNYVLTMSYFAKQVNANRIRNIWIRIPVTLPLHYLAVCGSTTNRHTSSSFSSWASLFCPSICILSYYHPAERQTSDLVSYMQREPVNITYHWNTSQLKYIYKQTSLSLLILPKHKEKSQPQTLNKKLYILP